MEFSSSISNAACVLMCLHMRQSESKKVRGREVQVEKKMKMVERWQLWKNDRIQGFNLMPTQSPKRQVSEAD